MAQNSAWNMRVEHATRNRTGTRFLGVLEALAGHSLVELVNKVGSDDRMYMMMDPPQSIHIRIDLGAVPAFGTR